MLSYIIYFIAFIILLFEIVIVVKTINRGINAKQLNKEDLLKIKNYIIKKTKVSLMKLAI